MKLTYRDSEGVHISRHHVGTPLMGIAVVAVELDGYDAQNRNCSEYFRTEVLPRIVIPAGADIRTPQYAHKYIEDIEFDALRETELNDAAVESLRKIATGPGRLAESLRRILRRFSKPQ